MAGPRSSSSTPRRAFAAGVIGVGGAWLALTDGRTATQRAAATGAHDLVLFDWALDYATCKRLAVARADGCADVALAAAVGALQSCGIAVSRVDDVAGLVVVRTVAMLVDEASDAVKEGVATADADRPRDADGRQLSARSAGVGRRDRRRARHATLIAHLRAHYGDARYRISPWLARRAAARTPLRDTCAMSADHDAQALAEPRGRVDVRARSRIAGARHAHRRGRRRDARAWR